MTRELTPIFALFFVYFVFGVMVNKYAGVLYFLLIYRIVLNKMIMRHDSSLSSSPSLLLKIAFVMPVLEEELF